MNAVLTSAPVRRPIRSSRDVPRAPRPLPGWVQFAALLLCLLQSCGPVNRLTAQARDMNGDGVIDAGDLVTGCTYNNANSKLTVTSPTGGVTTMAYDNLQRVTQITDALGGVTTFQYGPNSGGNAFDSSAFKPTRTVDPRGYATDVAYDALYRPITKSVQYVSGATPSTTSTRYDNVGNPTRVTDPLGHQTSTTYDALNRPLVTTYADGSNSSQAYTSTGFKWQTTDPNGHTTQTQYDAAGRLVAVIGATVDDGHGNQSSPVTQTFYDAAGNVAEIINPLGQKWDYVYDARNRKVQEFEPAVLDADPSSATYHTATRPAHTWIYDAAGRVTGIIDARGNETSSLYDAANRVTDINAPAVTFGGASVRPNTHTAYDNNGNVLTATDPNGHVTTNTYDYLNRLLTSTDAAGNVVTNTYDEVGNKVTVTDGKNQTTSFTYDGLNRNTTVTDAAGKSTTLRYDALNKTQRIDALGQTTTYLYDVRNRLSNVVYASSASANSQRNYLYDAAGNLLSVTEPSKTAANVAYTYDALNRAITETSNGLTHSYIYDLAGNRLSTVYGGTGRTITSTYDNLNRLLAMQEQTPAEITASAPGRMSSYGYDLNGNIIRKTSANGDTEAYSFDALNRPTVESGQSGGASSQYALTYGYDLAGNATTIGEQYPSGLNNRTVTNTYDNINRLHIEAVTGNAPNATSTYTYDSANNRVGKTITGAGACTTSYIYNNLNQLTSCTTGTNTETFNYDSNGNCNAHVVTGGSGAGADIYSYDIENRLIGLVKGTPGGIGTYAYQYDYRTRRITRDESRAGGVLTRVIFSGGTSVQEYDGANTTPTVEYIRGSDYGGGVGSVLYTIRSGTPSYTHANRRGDIIAKTDASGNLTFQDQYNSAGNQIATTGSTLDRQKSNSKDTDPWGGIDDGRRYTIIVGGDLRLFLTRDPMGMIDGPNEYTYCKQNPATYFDPEGLFVPGAGLVVAVGFEAYDTIDHALGGETNAQYAANSVINGLAAAADTTDGESGYVEVATNLALRKTAQVAAADALAHAATAATNGKGGKGSSSSSGGSPEGSSTETAPSKPTNAEPVKPGDKGNYGDLKDQKAANGETEPLQMDHQPSFAAQVKAKEAELGRKLSPQELKDLKNNTPAVASPTEVHQQTSPTYGGRNTAAQSDADAKDLQGAAARDKAAFDKAMSQRQSQQQQDQQQQNQQPPSK